MSHDICEYFFLPFTDATRGASPSRTASIPTMRYYQTLRFQRAFSSARDFAVSTIVDDTVHAFRVTFHYVKRWNIRGRVRDEQNGFRGTRRSQYSFTKRS